MQRYFPSSIGKAQAHLVVVPPAQQPSGSDLRKRDTTLQPQRGSHHGTPEVACSRRQCGHWHASAARPTDAEEPLKQLFPQSRCFVRPSGSRHSPAPAGGDCSDHSASIQAGAAKCTSLPHQPRRMLAAVQARLLEVVPHAPVRQGFQANVYVSPSAPFQERICTRAPHGQPARLSLGIVPQRAGNNLLCWHDFMRGQGTVPL